MSKAMNLQGLGTWLHYSTHHQLSFPWGTQHTITLTSPKNYNLYDTNVFLKKYHPDTPEDVIIISRSDISTVRGFCSGPLRHLIGFHHTIIRFCSMHTINLGLLYVCNAGALNLVKSKCRKVSFAKNIVGT